MDNIIETKSCLQNGPGGPVHMIIGRPVGGQVRCFQLVRLLILCRRLLRSGNYNIQ